MPLDSRNTYSQGLGYDSAAKLPLTDSIRLRANWGERIVTVLAASTAVLIVAVIAVLLGMT
jgi:hypothetical protein